MEEIIPVANHVEVLLFLLESAAIGKSTTFAYLLVAKPFRLCMSRRACQMPSKDPPHHVVLRKDLLRCLVVGVVVGVLRDKHDYENAHALQLLPQHWGAGLGRVHATAVVTAIQVQGACTHSMFKKRMQAHVSCCIMDLMASMFSGVWSATASEILPRRLRGLPSITI